MSQTEVTGYRVFIYDREEDPDIGRVIHLYGEDGIAAVCAFYVTPQVPYSHKRGSHLYVTFPDTAYRQILNLLRNESSIFVIHNERTGRIYLSTEEEGSGEGRRS